MFIQNKASVDRETPDYLEPELIHQKERMRDTNQIPRIDVISPSPELPELRPALSVHSNTEKLGSREVLALAIWNFCDPREALADSWSFPTTAKPCRSGKNELEAGFEEAGRPGWSRARREARHECYSNTFTTHVWRKTKQVQGYFARRCQYGSSEKDQ